MIGAAATQLGAMAASRRTWNTEEIRAKRDFHVEVIGAAHEQLILLSNIVTRLTDHVADARRRRAGGETLTEADTQYLHDEHHLTRLQAATDKWRSTYAKSVVYGGPAMHAVLAELDKKRARAVEAVNGSDFDAIPTSIDEFERTLKSFYKEVKRSTIEANLVLNGSLMMWPWNIRVRRDLAKQLEDLDQDQTG